MSVYLGKNKVGITKYEDLDTELTEQEEALAVLEADVEALEDKPKDIMQQMIDKTKSCNYLFYGYIGTSLDFVKNLDTSEATYMEGMFAECPDLTGLDLTWMDTSNAWDMLEMFKSCSSLESLDVSSFNTSKVIDMSYMFYGCSGLTSLDLSSFNTSKVTNTSSMFQRCTKLENIIGIIDMIKVTSVTSMFQSCTNITNITLKNIKKSLQLGTGTSYGTKLSNDSTINTIQELWDLTGSTSQTLYLSSITKLNIENIYVKLITPTAEQIEADPYINNKKPCVVCESTDDGAMLITEYITSKNWALA